MRTSALEHLRCPSRACCGQAAEPCGGWLALDDKAMEAVWGKTEGELLQGMLRCESCGALYPVAAGVAIVVPDARAYLRRFGSEVLRAVQAVESKAPCATPRMTSFLAMAGRAPLPDSSAEPDDCLDVYLHAHFGSGTEEDATSLDEAVTGYLRGNFYERQCGLLSQELIASGGAAGRALDIGCSVGGMTLRMADVFEEAFGVDLSFPSILQARQVLLNEPCAPGPISVETEPGVRGREAALADLRRDNVEFAVASATALPFASGWVDCAASINCIDVLPDPERHGAEIARVLGPGGLLHLCDPLCFGQKVLEDAVGRFGSPSAFLEALIEESGMEVLESRDVPWALRVNDRQANLYRCRCIAARKTT